MYGVSLNKQKIEMLLKDFNSLTGIRIAFVTHDFTDSINAEKEICEFCEILRQDENADKKCRNCDKIAYETATAKGELYIYECHIGITEAVTPLIIENRILGYLMMGQTLNMPPTIELWQKICDTCNNYQVDLKALESAFYKMNHLEHQKIYAAANIMEMCAKYMHSFELVKIHDMSLIQKVKLYIDVNLENPINIAGASKELNVSISHLSHAIKKELGCSFIQYSLLQKMKKAQRMLEEGKTPVKDISAALGFSDQNYFPRVFKKTVGCSPIDYRKNYK